MNGREFIEYAARMVAANDRAMADFSAWEEEMPESTHRIVSLFIL